MSQPNVSQMLQAGLVIRWLQLKEELDQIRDDILSEFNQGNEYIEDVYNRNPDLETRLLTHLNKVYQTISNHRNQILSHHMTELAGVLEGIPISDIYPTWKQGFIQGVKAFDLEQDVDESLRKLARALDTSGDSTERSQS